MAFVNERITEEDKKRIDFSAIKLPIFYDRPIPNDHLYKWTVDREREVFFMRLKRRGEEFPNSSFYTLWWKGDIIYLELETDIWTNECKWIVRMLKIPHHLQGKREEIVQLLKEALEVFGSFYGDPFSSISLAFNERKGIFYS
jgi:hypothetical protein